MSILDSNRTWPLIIIGGGPAAALQLSRLKYPERVLIISENFGGNMDIMGDLHLQSYIDELEIKSKNISLQSFTKLSDITPTGTQYVSYIQSLIKNSPALKLKARVHDISKKGNKMEINIAQKYNSQRFNISAKFVILATGTRPKKPPSDWKDVGVIPFTQVFRDLAQKQLELYKNKAILIIGSGNSAMQLAVMLARLAANVTVLAKRYVGMYPHDTNDRFAWRGSSHLAYELIAKSQNQLKSLPSPYHVRYIVYDKIYIDDKVNVNFSYSSYLNKSILGHYSLNSRPNHSCIKYHCSEPGEYSETFSNQNRVVIWATGVEPSYPKGSIITCLSRDNEGFISCDSHGQTEIPSLFQVGSCRARCRSINEMYPVTFTDLMRNNS